MRLSQVHPVFYHIRVWQMRLERDLIDLGRRRCLAGECSLDTLPNMVMEHRSTLRKRLGDTDPQLQENKITNLRIALGTMNGITIRPGQVFSFWRCVGNPTADRGYLDGLELSDQGVGKGVGGGLCQLANLLYWMALHTPLEVVEHHHHSFDAFPDDGRVLPFGSGASVFYNYVDLRLHNNTDQTFQFRIWLTELHLHGSVHTERELPQSCRIEERKHRFVRQGEQIYRENEIWRIVTDRATGDTTEELVTRNHSEVRYQVDERLVETR